MEMTTAHGVDLAERMTEDKIRIEVSDTSTTDSPAAVVPPMWRVVVHLGRRRLCLPYYKTESHEQPAPRDVMLVLIREALGIEASDTLEGWARVEPGAPVDIRSEQAYHAQRVQTARLRYLLGERYDVYLHHTVL